MTKKIIVLALPGIGTRDTDFSMKMSEAIRKHSSGTSLENNTSVIELKPYSVVPIDENQRELYSRIDAGKKFGGHHSLRDFMMRTVDDALLFERNAQAIDSPYRKIHLYLRNEIKKVNGLMEAYPGSHLVIVAASLGVHILSTYIWDADHSLGVFHENPADRTDNLRNLDYLVSIGCNIPLFVSRLHETEIKAIDKRNIHFTWDNFYDRDDVLSWPLEPLSPSYRELVTDYEINSGLYTGSHVRHWDDNDFIVPLTRHLLELYEHHTVGVM